MTGVVRAERDKEVRVAYLAKSLAKGILDLVVENCALRRQKHEGLHY